MPEVASSIRVGAYAAIVRDGRLLLIACRDDGYDHFNLPGGGVHPGESVRDALRREVREETCAAVDVGSLLLVWEYVPDRHDGRYGPQPKLGLLFRCRLRAGSEPRLPATPDEFQVGVSWSALGRLETVELLPRITGPLLDALGRSGEVGFCPDV